jgi:hypothetical protein
MRFKKYLLEQEYKKMDRATQAINKEHTSDGTNNE